MGYRSEVAIKCEEKAYQMLIDTCKNVGLMPDTVYKDDDKYILKWDCIKWYDLYPEVKAIEKCLKEFNGLYCEGKKEGCGYKFIRIGEENEDIEEYTNDYDIDLLLIRKIDIPCYAERIEEL